jgi:DNA helicase-2/ATP-dependent DNA helicase PcrA
MNRADAILAALDADQRAICQVIEGPVAVIAGPGSGKTRVLTHRIAYMIARGVSDRDILGITFTNKAAQEMKTRLRDLLKGEAKPFVATFHATGAFFLRQTADAVGLTCDFTIYDEDESRAVIKSVRASTAQKRLARLSDESIASLIEKAKRAGHLPADTPADDEFGDEFRAFYADYQAGLRARNAADFADLILYPLRLFVENPERMAPLARRFKYILVDEFQDIDASQYWLVRHLAKEHRNLFVVGDQDQSIYGFRGADPGFLEQFVRDFPSAKVMYLERNYRSRPSIVKAATEIARHSPFSFRKNLRSIFDEDASRKPGITLVETQDDGVQSEEIGRQAQRLIRAGIPPSEIAILYRAHYLSAPIEYALAARKIPYRVVRGLRFLERKVVKDAVSFLRVTVNPQDIAAWERVCARPPHGIGEKTMAKIASLLAREKADPIGSLEDRARFPPPFQALCGMIQEAALQTGKDLSALLTGLLRDSGYFNWLEEAEEGETDSVAHLEGLEKLLRRATGDGKTLSQFLQELSLWSEQDTEGAGERVQLMTLHAAKGLEFRAVLMPDLIEEILPHKRSLETGIGLDEERRLFYVGITRARDSVVLYRPLLRHGYGGARPKRTTPSRYLAALPRDLIERRPVRI